MYAPPLPTHTLPISATREMTRLWVAVNSDVAPARWEILDCTNFNEAADLPPFSFSHCGGTSADVLNASTRTQVQLKYSAPTLVGEYLSFHTLTGAGPAGPVTSRWNIESSILVVPDAIDPQASEVSLNQDIVARDPARIDLLPRDSFGNEISTFGLSFIATSTQASNGEQLDFPSTFEPITSTYFVEVVLMSTGEYSLEVRYSETDALVPPELHPTVLSLVCDTAVSEPNAAGEACICLDGFARQPNGECGRCDIGWEPKGAQPGDDPTAREKGCDPCSRRSGTVSPGPDLGPGTPPIRCDACPTGFAPNEAYGECVPCDEGEFFDVNSERCKACDDGKELFGVGLPRILYPCSNCSGVPQDLVEAGSAAGFDDSQCPVCPIGQMPTPGRDMCICQTIGPAAGLGGTCAMCEDGKQPNLIVSVTPTMAAHETEMSLGDVGTTIADVGGLGDRQECRACPTGQVSRRGQLCSACEPGKYATADQKSCVWCPAGRYRNEEVRPDCVPCYPGLTCDVGSTNVTACHCGLNTYDLWDADQIRQSTEVDTGLLDKDGYMSCGDGSDKPPRFWAHGVLMDDKPPRSDEPPILGMKFEDCWQPTPIFKAPEEPNGINGLIHMLTPPINVSISVTGDDGSAAQPSWAWGKAGEPYIDGVLGNPIWCFPDGRVNAPNNVPENKNSYSSVKSLKRCVACPDCLDCAFDGYRGMPFVKGGWTTVNDDLKDDNDAPGRYHGCGGDNCGLPSPDAPTADYNCSAGDGAEGPEVRWWDPVTEAPVDWQSEEGGEYNPDSGIPEECEFDSEVESVRIPDPPETLFKEDVINEAGLGHYHELPGDGSEDAEPALVQPEYAGKERNVLGCPYGLREQSETEQLPGAQTEGAKEAWEGEKQACEAERDYRVPQKLNDHSNKTRRVERCGPGYAGKLWCATLPPFVSPNVTDHRPFVAARSARRATR